MSDKELLELAAKAAGIDDIQWNVVEDGTYRGGWSERHGKGDYGWWNPLTDDAGALQLAVKLGIEVCFPYLLPQEIQTVRAGADIFEATGNDPYAATRRAIVRAAAEIGKTQP